MLKKRQGRVRLDIVLSTLTVAFLGISAVSAQNQAIAPSNDNKVHILANTASKSAPGTVNAQDVPQKTSQLFLQKNLIPGLTYRYINNQSPTKIEVSDSQGWLATFTNGARSVSLRGPSRTFSEPTTTAASVTHNVWVRLLPAPFSGIVDHSLLQSMLGDTRPDVLAIAMQYIDGSSPVTNAAGLTISSDASYGPSLADGSREEGADFNDYLGIPQQYGPSTDTPEGDQLGSLDCSGYLRMVFGYRLGMPLGRQPDASQSFIPRRAVQIYEAAPGPVIVAQGNPAAASLGRLNPGDVVFQDTSTDDGTAIDHTGIFLGIDSQGNYRFISSRKIANGPTMGDVGGKSILNGNGLYAKSFVAARRV